MDAPITREILHVLKNHPTVRMAILFGSLASGRGTAESDLDLAMDAGRPLDLSLKMQLISELAIESGGRSISSICVVPANRCWVRFFDTERRFLATTHIMPI